MPSKPSIAIGFRITGGIPLAGQSREIETERLVLRPFVPEDLPAYAAIRRKPGVTRFLPSHTEDPDASDKRAEKTSSPAGKKK